LEGAGGLLAVLVPLVPPTTQERLVDTSGDSAQGFNGRTALWSEAWFAFQKHPFTGVGTGAFRDEATWKVAHNVWLRFAAELGLIGIGLLLLLIALLLVGASRRPGALRQFSFTILLVWMIGATFYNSEDKKQTWLVLSLVMVAASLGEDRRRTRPIALRGRPLPATTP